MSGSPASTVLTSQLRPILELAGLVVTPSALLSGLLLYFARVYTSARLSYFGIDPSIAAFSTQEYLIRSIQPIFIPLGVLAALGLILIGVHGTVARWVASPRSRTALTALYLLLGLAGVGLLAIGLMGVLGRPAFGIELLITPACLAFGTLGLSYALSVRSGLLSTPSPRPRWRSITSRALVALLIVLNVFWAMGDWATGLGRGRAQDLANQLAMRAPGVVLYSKESLGIEPSTGVTVDDITEEGSLYQVRYDGLRLFLYADSKYFLLPSDWSPETGVVMVLPVSDTFRIELTPS